MIATASLGLFFSDAAAGGLPWTNNRFEIAIIEPDHAVVARGSDTEKRMGIVVGWTLPSADVQQHAFRIFSVRTANVDDAWNQLFDFAGAP